jgi:hypothetical protein
VAKIPPVQQAVVMMLSCSQGSRRANSLFIIYTYLQGSAPNPTQFLSIAGTSLFEYKKLWDVSQADFVDDKAIFMPIASIKANKGILIARIG